MATITDFALTARGSKGNLQRLKEMILADTTPISEGPFADQFILTLKPETWGDLTDSQEWLWLREIRYCRCEPILGEYGIEQDELKIVGEAKYCPPLVFAARIVEMFADVDLELYGTTEHEEYEHWHSNYDDPRKLICDEWRVTDLRTDTILSLVIDGQQILPREGANNVVEKERTADGSMEATS